MKQPIQIDSLLPESVADDSFSTILPEYYQLRHVIESNGWHNDQSVFDHSLACTRALRNITQFDYLVDRKREILDSYLAQSVEGHTRMELLNMATLFHDMGKSISLQHNSQGDTSSPSHGLLGAWVAQPLLEKFEISVKEKTFILALIADHLVPSDLIELSINNRTDSQRIVNLLKQYRFDSAVELLLLAYADWLGCDIRDESVRVERDKRVAVVHDCLSVFATT
jgi:UTP:GlnB (protein PII) uridylyltransferase